MSPKPDVLPDLMSRLTEARPSTRLDPIPDGARRQQDLSLILASPGDTRSWPRRVIPRTVDRQAGFGLAAAASVAAVATVIATGSLGAGQPAPKTPGNALPAAPGTGAPGTAGPASLSAAQILLLAADQVQAAPATTGKYWLERGRDVEREQVGPAGNRYQVQLRNRDESWTARSAHGTSLWISQNLGVTPAGPADEAAWKRDGSPKGWTIALLRAQGVGRLRVGSAPGIPFGNQTNSGAEVYSLGSHNVSVRDLQRLPADPAKLKSLLVKDFRTGGGGGELPSTENAWLFQVAGSLLEMPVTTGVRAAAYRLIAGLDGVRSLGSVTDLDGRAGNGVALRQTNATGLGEDRIIIQPSTGLPLAEEYAYLKPAGIRAWLKPCQVWHAHLIDSIGWTNDTPPKLPKSGS